MSRHSITIIISFILGILSAQAYKIEAKRGEIKDSYNFWFYQPDSVSADSESRPIIVFLHGASLCGNNLERVRRYGTIDAIERGRKLDAYVVAPQNPGGSWNPKKVMSIVDWAMENANVDSTRVYVVGMSLGGYGTIDVAATYPDRIAAAMAFCGGGTAKHLGKLNELPLWIVHGTGDKAVKVSESDKVVNAMKAVNKETPRLIYDRVPGMGHAQPARFFYMPETYDWLFEHSLTDENRPVSKDYNIVSGIHSAYKNLKSNGTRKKKATPKKRRKRSSKKK